MLTPSQEFEQLLDRYRFTEGLCAADQGAPQDEPPPRAFIAPRCELPPHRTSPRLAGFPRPAWLRPPHG